MTHDDNIKAQWPFLPKASDYGTIQVPSNHKGRQGLQMHIVDTLHIASGLQNNARSMMSYLKTKGNLFWIGPDANLRRSHDKKVSKSRNKSFDKTMLATSYTQLLAVCASSGSSGKKTVPPVTLCIQFMDKLKMSA